MRAWNGYQDWNVDMKARERTEITSEKKNEMWNMTSTFLTLQKGLKKVL